MRFTAGWVRLTLSPCPGAAGATGTRLVVRADRRLRFSAGRSGGVTVGLLSGADEAEATGAQTFILPRGSGHARELGLAPWPSPTPAPRLDGAELRAEPADAP